jgi:4-hydroxyphenylpyruvate dioxygenase
VTSPVLGFGTLELSTGNARQAAAFFATMLGFTVVAGPERNDDGSTVSYRLRQGAAELLLTGATSPGSPVAEFVRRHGDGVAGVEFVVDPTAVAPTAAAAVTGVAGLRHTLVGAPTTRADVHPGVGIVGIDHLAISVAPGTRHTWARHYQDSFGFVALGDDEHIDLEGSVFDLVAVHARPDSRGCSDDVRLVFAEPGPGPRQSQIAHYLAEFGGPGVHHIALATDDIVATTAELRRRGLRTLAVPEGYFARARARLSDAELPWDDLERHGLLVDRDEHGHLVQVFTEPIGDRDTVYLELIQRVGATGFGHDNIRALYAGVVSEQRIGTAENVTR